MNKLLSLKYINFNSSLIVFKDEEGNPFSFQKHSTINYEKKKTKVTKQIQEEIYKACKETFSITKSFVLLSQKIL